MGASSSGAADMHEQRIGHHCTAASFLLENSRCCSSDPLFFGESEPVISAPFLAQCGLQAKGSSWASVQPPIRLEPLSRLLMQRIEEIMDWIPISFIAFKLLVIGAAVFFSIRSHREKEKEEQEEERERQARASRAGSALQLGQVQQHVEASPCARQSGPG
jgi:hypothetical protein